MTIGAAAEKSAEEFHNVTAARLLGDTAVLVVNAGTHELRVYDLRGQLIRSFGREGRGPGENMHLTDVYLVSDTIFAYDSQLQRVQLFSGEGNLLDLVDLRELADQRLWPRGVQSDGSILAVAPVPGFPSEDGTHSTEVDVVLLQREAENVEVLLNGIFWDETYFVTRDLPGDVVGRTGYPAPLAPKAALVSSGAHFWYSDGRTPILTRYSVEGSVVARVQLPFEPTPVNRTRREAYTRRWLESVSESARPRLRAVLEEMSFPDYLPIVGDLVVAADGSVWVGEYIEEEGIEARKWIVVSSEGRVIRQVQLPGDLELLDVCGHLAVGVQRDAYDVEQLVVLAIQALNGASRRER